MQTWILLVLTTAVLFGTLVLPPAIIIAYPSFPEPEENLSPAQNNGAIELQGVKIFGESSFSRDGIRILFVIPKKFQHLAVPSHALILVVIDSKLNLPSQDLIGKVMDIKGLWKRADLGKGLTDDELYYRILNEAKFYGLISDLSSTPSALPYIEIEYAKVSEGD